MLAVNYKLFPFQEKATNLDNPILPKSPPQTKELMFHVGKGTLGAHHALHISSWRSNNGAVIVV